TRPGSTIGCAVDAGDAKRQDFGGRSVVERAAWRRTWAKRPAEALSSSWRWRGAEAGRLGTLPTPLWTRARPHPPRTKKSALGPVRGSHRGTPTFRGPDRGKFRCITLTGSDAPD